MANSSTSAPTKTALIFLASVALGGVAWFFVFARGFAGVDAAAETRHLVIGLWCGGAFAVSALTGAFQRSSGLLWCTGFAVPMLGWGLFCACCATTDRLGVLWWTAFGLATAVAALIGAWVGRAFGSRLRDTNHAEPGPRAPGRELEP